MIKRKVEVAVISDVHLGTYGSHARELNHYLKSIIPKILILNGDIIDGWQFSKNYWPAAHTQVLRRILKLLQQGTRVIYLTGNHDEMLRRYSGIMMGSFELRDKIVLEIDKKKYWIFHGDVFDVSMKHGKLLAKLGSKGYDMLILLNRFVNFVLEKTGHARISFSKRVKDGVKRAVKFVSDYEQTITGLAIENKYDFVICGHIHQPLIRRYVSEKGSCTYMNSGDWIENLSVLEYVDKQWQLQFYHDLFPDGQLNNLSEDREKELLTEAL